MSIGYPPNATRLPTHLDLPHPDDKPVENTYQPEQSAMLTAALTPHLDRLHPDGNYFIGQDCGIYWENTKLPLDGCKCPDWYYVPNVPHTLDDTWRRSYVMWNEIAAPLLIAEWVSGNGDEEHDTTENTGKFWVYERGIRAVYYLIYDPYTENLEVFELIRGRYQPLVPNAEGRFRIPAMALEFGIWEGFYHHIQAPWLRAWDLNGVLIPTDHELAQRYGAESRRHEAESRRHEAESRRHEAESRRHEADSRQERLRADAATRQVEEERNRVEAASRQAEEERTRAAKLAAKLRELGVDPDAV